MLIKFLKIQYVNQAKKDEELKFKLAKANPKRSGEILKLSTIDRWLTETDPMLTTATNLSIIADHFEIADINELLGQEEMIEV